MIEAEEVGALGVHSSGHDHDPRQALVSTAETTRQDLKAISHAHGALAAV